MSFRPAPVGSLLKGERSAKPKPGKRQAPAFNAAKHLRAVRCLPCISCDADPAGVAAHLRMASEGKPEAGMGRKPDDTWVTPICAWCHTDGAGAQHRGSEREWWGYLGIDPLWLCAALVAVSPDVERMRNVVFRAREMRK